jgi:hypothetical protein
MERDSYAFLIIRTTKQVHVGIQLQNKTKLYLSCLNILHTMSKEQLISVF